MASSRVVLSLQIIACCFSFAFCSSRFDDSNYDRIEKRGNMTFGCTSSGPCSPCSYSEKSDDETYHCSTTGYRQSFRCVELGEDGSQARRDLFSQETSERGIKEFEALGHSGLSRKVLEPEDTTTHDEHQVLHAYTSCVPTETNEKISVLGFEGIILGLLALSAPLIYHRKRRNLTMSGMSRLPTSSRF